MCSIAARHSGVSVFLLSKKFSIRTGGSVLTVGRSETMFEVPGTINQVHRPGIMVAAASSKSSSTSYNVNIVQKARFTYTEGSYYPRLHSTVRLF